MSLGRQQTSREKDRVRRFQAVFSILCDLVGPHSASHLETIKMRANHASPTSWKSGFSLIELLVVILIITIMVALLMPALQRARAAANRAVCQNNLHQLALAMRQYVGAYRRFPKPAPVNSVGGWSVEILVFLEQKAWRDDLMKNPTLNPVALSPFAILRPKVMTCPMGSAGDSTIAKIPVAHYVLLTNAKGIPTAIADTPIDFHGPWVTGPTMSLLDCKKRTGPHDGGFYIAEKDGSVHFSLEDGFQWPE